MRIRIGNFTAKFVLLAILSLSAAFQSAVAQTSATPPAAGKPKASRRSDASSAKAPAKPGAMAPRGVQRGEFTQDDKATFEKEIRSAIIVAPSYRDSGLATLRYTFADAVELKGELERQGYTVRVIPSTEATADGIRQTLTNQKTFLEGTNQSTLLFAFMGHGFQDSRGQNFLMTYGADPKNMEKEALSLDEVQSLITASGARRKVIFIDACRNVAGTRDAEKPRSMADFKAAEGLAILLATKPGAYSYEDPELSHGVFTYFLLEGLRGKAAGKDGFVSFHDLSEYVEKAVSTYAMKKDQAQRPLATMKDVGGDFLLGTAAVPKPDEVKAVAGASEITSDAVIMRAVSLNKSFFVALADGTLTLVESSTGQPFSILTEHPEQLKDTAETSKRTLRWFAGDASNSALHVVVELKGNDIVNLWGRLGKPCPDGKTCSPTPFPLLPGEIRDQKSAAVTNTRKSAMVVLQSPFGRKPKSAATNVQSSSSALEKSGLAADSRDKFTWTKFDLANTVRLKTVATQEKKP